MLRKPMSPSDLQKLEVGDRVTKGSYAGSLELEEEVIVTEKTATYVTISISDSVYKEKKDKVRALAKVLGGHSEEELDEMFNDTPPHWDFDISTGKELPEPNPFGITTFIAVNA